MISAYIISAIINTATYTTSRVIATIVEKVLGT